MTRAVTAATRPLGRQLGTLAVTLGMMGGLMQHMQIYAAWTTGHAIDSQQTLLAALPLILAFVALQFSSWRRVQTWYACTMAGWLTGLAIIPTIIFAAVHQWMGLPLFP